LFYREFRSLYILRRSKVRCDWRERQRKGKREKKEKVGSRKDS